MEKATEISVGNIHLDVIDRECATEEGRNCAFSIRKVKLVWLNRKEAIAVALRFGD